MISKKLCEAETCEDVIRRIKEKWDHGKNDERSYPEFVYQTLAAYFEKERQELKAENEHLKNIIKDTLARQLRLIEILEGTEPTPLPSIALAVTGTDHVMEVRKKA